MPLRFVKSESTFTYFEATRGYLEKHGKPLALYSDKASVFRINKEIFSLPPYPNWTAVGVNWLAGFDFEIKVIARIP